MRYVVISEQGQLRHLSMPGDVADRAACINAFRFVFAGVEPEQIPCKILGWAAFHDANGGEHGRAPNAIGLNILFRLGGPVTVPIVWGPVVLMGVRDDDLIGLTDAQIIKLDEWYQAMANAGRSEWR